METDESHAAPSTATAAAADDGGGEGAASADPDEGVTESDLFSEEDKEGGGDSVGPAASVTGGNV